MGPEVAPVLPGRQKRSVVFSTLSVVPQLLALVGWGALDGAAGAEGRWGREPPPVAGTRGAHLELQTC